MSSAAAPRRTEPRLLSANEHADFLAHGFVRVSGAFPAAAAVRMQDRLWAELRDEYGIERDDRTTWWQPVRDLRGAKRDPVQSEIAGGRLIGAIDALLGTGCWSLPRTWGRVIITFPDHTRDAWNVPTDVWHWDTDLRSNATGLQGLVIFLFVSAVAPGGGGTVIVSGSHRLLQQFYASLPVADRARGQSWFRKEFLRWDPWLRDLSGASNGPADRVTHFMAQPREVRGIPVRVVELTGQPGDAILCHPLMLHTTAPNRSTVPRFMRAKILNLTPGDDSAGAG